MSPNAEIVDLLAQLEEAKFLRLFRYLAIENASEHNLPREPIPLSLPNSELHVQLAGHIGSIDTRTATWCFQIAHLVTGLWGIYDSESFVNARLQSAFQDLRDSGDAEGLLRGDSVIPLHLRGGFKPEQIDYYLFTNFFEDVSNSTLERFSDQASKIFEAVLPAIPCPHFGIGTPQTFAANMLPEVRNYLADLINLPSSFYLLAREGRISVVPVTEHGRYLVEGVSPGRSEPGVWLAAPTTSLREEENPQLVAFENLLNDPNNREGDFQEFLGLNPNLLFSLDERYCDIRPHVCLFDSSGERLIPDFMVRLEGTSAWDVIELKLPQHSLYSSRKGAQSVSAPAARAISQLLQYRDFFASADNRKAINARFGLGPYEPGLILVIGRGRESYSSEWRSTRLGFPKVKIMSYDYLFARAQECAKRYIDPKCSKGH